MTSVLLTMSLRPMKTMSNTVVIHERFPYRFVQNGTLENGKPDCRIQKFDEYRHMYKDMYYCDNQMQFGIAIEDLEYTKWLDPAGVPCYRKND